MTRIVIVTGLSGSGKTLAAKALEDSEYFSIDNLPVPLMLPFIELLDRGDAPGTKGAVVVDAREAEHLAALPEMIARLRSRDGLALSILFLEASDETIQRRFQASRRPHPLAMGSHGTLETAIRRERELLSPLRALADRTIDTDDLTPHDLRRIVQDVVRDGPRRETLRCSVVSFGFKYGGPNDADMVLDVRFLKNPYFVDRLKLQSGLDREVVDYLEQQADFGEYMKHVEELLEFVLPRFVHEGKSYLTLAIGCTGGRHRSVAIAERLARFIQERGYPATVDHRDLAREGRPREAS